MRSRFRVPSNRSVVAERRPTPPARVAHIPDVLTSRIHRTRASQLLEKRPLSPDVFDIDGSSTHYKFPAVALSSITNRVTGCVLSGAVAFGGSLCAVGGPEALPAFIEGFKSTVPFLVFPAKALVGFPFVYHTLGGFRHIVWDKTTNASTTRALGPVPSVCSRRPGPSPRRWRPTPSDEGGVRSRVPPADPRVSVPSQSSR